MNTGLRASFATMPTEKPCPDFSSGPCKKRPGWSTDVYKTAPTGRSHRSKIGKAKLAQAIADTKRILGIPEDYFVGIVPASDTGAIEMAMWTMMGERPVDVVHWESFGKGWYSDIKTHLKIKDVNEITAEYGQLPDLSKTNKDHDIIFTWNGTTSGVCVPNGDWIADDRTGLTFNDATSAVFAMDVDWSKVDVTTYSWQKVMGGEGAHGMLILSPRAVARLESYTPENRPLPKIFRLTKKGKFDESIFTGATINTPSMVCVEDYLDSMAWAESIGGLKGLMARSQANLGAVTEAVNKLPWLNFLAADEVSRSCTSVCLTVDMDKAKLKEMIAWLEAEDVAYDIGAYRDAPDGLRVWCGATVETKDVKLLMQWLEYAYEKFSK